jgi:hypothetical protein
MNIFEMHIGVNLGVQKIASHINGDLLTEEIDYYLNNSITEYVKQQYSIIRDGNNDMQSQYVLENLRTLIKTQDLQPSAEYIFIPNAREFILPNDYKYHLKSSAIFNGGKRKSTQLVEPDKLERYFATLTNSPLFRKLPLFIENNKVVIIGDAIDTISDGILYLTYIKEPVTVKLVTSNIDEYVPGNSFDSDLPAHTHKEIVDMTIAQILRDLTQFKE